MEINRFDFMCSLLCLMLVWVSLLRSVSRSLLSSCEVLVWRVGFRDESGAICQVEDLLTVRHSCWSIVGAFADVVYGLSSILAPLLLTVASEVSILGWVVISIGCMRGMFKCFYSEFGFSPLLLNSQIVLSRLWLFLRGSGFVWRCLWLWLFSSTVKRPEVPCDAFDFSSVKRFGLRRISSLCCEF